MQWFRLYNDLRHDPKVQNLRPELFRFWINLLCMASDQKTRGVIPSIDSIATDLGMRRDHVERFMASLEASNLVIRTPLEGSNERLMGALDAFEIHGWSTRQPKSDDVAKRVKSHRDKRSGENESREPVDEKRYTEESCNVLDSETDTETDHRQKTGDDEDVRSAQESPPQPEAQPNVETPPDPVSEPVTRQILRMPDPVPADTPDVQTPAVDDGPNFPGPEGPVEMLPGQYPMSEDEAQRLFVMIWKAFGDRRLCYEFYEIQQKYPFDFWLAGIRKVSRKGTLINAISYIEKVISGFKGKIPKVDMTCDFEAVPPPKQPTYYTRRSTRPIVFVPRDGTRG